MSAAVGGKSKTEGQPVFSFTSLRQNGPIPGWNEKLLLFLLDELWVVRGTTHGVWKLQ